MVWYDIIFALQIFTLIISTVPAFRLNPFQIVCSFVSFRHDSYNSNHSLFGESFDFSCWVRWIANFHQLQVFTYIQNTLLSWACLVQEGSERHEWIEDKAFKTTVIQRIVLSSTIIQYYSPSIAYLKFRAQMATATESLRK